VKVRGDSSLFLLGSSFHAQAWFLRYPDQREMRGDVPRERMHGFQSVRRSVEFARPLNCFGAMGIMAAR